MRKRVNVYPSTPILSLNIPIRSTMKNVYLSTDDIRKCLISGAKVEEILNDGSTTILTLYNYTSVNTPIAAAPAPVEIETVNEPVVETEVKVAEAIEEPMVAEEAVVGEENTLEAKEIPAEVIEEVVTEPVVEETVETPVEEEVVETKDIEATTTESPTLVTGNNGYKYYSKKKRKNNN